MGKLQLNRLPRSPGQSEDHYYDIPSGVVYKRSDIEAKRGLVRDEQGRIVRSEEWKAQRIDALLAKRSDLLNRLENVASHLEELGIARPDPAPAIFPAEPMVAEFDLPPVFSVAAIAPYPPQDTPELTGWRGWLSRLLRSILARLEGSNG